MDVFGYVNGKPVYSRDEYIYTKRRFGALETDEELMAFAEKVTCHWHRGGWEHGFIDFYLSDYALSEPYRSLTKVEFERLKELQREAEAKHKAEEDAKEWRLDHTIYWADNSVEEVWINKYGEKRSVMTVQPHGDCC